MRKRLLFVLALMTFGLTGAWADELTGKQALELAQQFVASHNLRKSTPTVKEAGQVSGLYVFNVSNNGGFVIVSNDDQTVPILGFGQSGNIDINDLPDNMRAWLEGYADQIVWLQRNGNDGANGTKGTRRTNRTAKADVSPLITSHWNQGAPYNNLCPEIDDEKTVTGCVATTTAQLMYYHYLHNGFAASSTALEGYTASTRNKARTSINLNVSGLDATTFNWANMTTTYGKASTEEAKTAVAKLMQYVGTALHMSYGLSANGGSSAYSEAIPYALKHCFGYDRGVHHCYRKNYSYAAWVDLIYSELAANRPVALGGQSAGGGHSFICDGYKSESDIDYFHINWGWGGACDEYFVLSVLQPWEQGIGGSSTLDGFSFGQDVVLGIQPPAGNKDYCMSLEGLHLGGDDKTLTSKTFTRANSSEDFTGISLYYDVWNYNYGSTAYDVTVQLVDDNGKVWQTFGGANNQKLSWNKNINATLGGSIPSGLDNGTYYIKVMSKPSSETNWQECFDGDAYQLTAVISDNDLTISVPIPADITPASVTFAVSGESSTGSEQTVTATVTAANGNYAGNIVLRVNDTAVMGQIAQIPAGATVDLTFSYIPSLVGDNVLTLWTHRSSGDQIPGSEKVSISTLVIDNNTDNTSLIQINNRRTGNVKLADRTLYKDGAWNTLCLPFDLTLAGSTLSGDNVEAMVLHSSDSGLDGTTLTLNFDNAPATIPAGTPFIIRWTSGEDLKNPEFNGVTVSDATNNAAFTGGSFCATYDYIRWTKETPSILFLGDNNNLHWPDANASLGACRAYFWLNGGGSAREFKLNFDGEVVQTTGIGRTDFTDITERADAWYTVNGVKLSGMPRTRGIYVKNGKKIVVK